MANIKTDKRTGLFESVPIPRAVVALCVPTIISSLVMVLYNLADTYFRSEEHTSELQSQR